MTKRAFKWLSRSFSLLWSWLKQRRWDDIQHLLAQRDQARRRVRLPREGVFPFYSYNLKTKRRRFFSKIKRIKDPQKRCLQAASHRWFYGSLRLWKRSWSILKSEKEIAKSRIGIKIAILQNLLNWSAPNWIVASKYSEGKSWKEKLSSWSWKGLTVTIGLRLTQNHQFSWGF